ncbi:MAG TPA: shikimate kinase [Rhizobiales bacterium]|nr:shikimate kinase [Hyphomicrobiales bacterium]
MSQNHEIKQIHERLGKRSIVLIGLMGAGKTTIGRRLAARLDLPFVDSDQAIEEAAGQSIADIFAAHGEAHFRTGERKVISRLLKSGPQVLATGGGAFMNPKTRARIQENGVSVWLKASLEILMERVQRRSHRPLLQEADPEGIMKKLINERYPVYEQADFTVISTEDPHEAIVTATIMEIAHMDPAKS